MATELTTPSRGLLPAIKYGRLADDVVWQCRIGNPGIPVPTGQSLAAFPVFQTRVRANTGPAGMVPRHILLWHSRAFLADEGSKLQGGFSGWLPSMEGKTPRVLPASCANEKTALPPGALRPTNSPQCLQNQPQQVELGSPTNLLCGFLPLLPAASRAGASSLGCATGGVSLLATVPICADLACDMSSIVDLNSWRLPWRGGGGR